MTHPRHFTVGIREHRDGDFCDEEGTVTRTATMLTKAAAERWIRREICRPAPGATSVVGEATEYEDDPRDGFVPVAYGHFAEGDDAVEWWPAS